MIPDDLIRSLRVPPGKKIRLRDFLTDGEQIPHLKPLGKHAAKDRAQEFLKQNLDDLAEAQELLYADDRYSVLVILQALDAAGKDGTIKHVMSGVNPQGCQVFSFKKPSAEELDHNFLWRCMKCLPERGRIGIFNRSYYEEVLVVKVHPELLELQRLPVDGRGKSFWQDRYDDVNAFERHLARNGTIILKFFLHVSKQEQKERFLARLNDPQKLWKFSPGDVAEREFWDQYVAAYEDCLSATSTEWAPWYVVPADQKWITRAVVADILTTTLTGLDMKYPQQTAAQRLAFDEARKKLEEE